MGCNTYAIIAATTSGLIIPRKYQMIPIRHIMTPTNAMYRDSLDHSWESFITGSLFVKINLSYLFNREVFVLDFIGGPPKNTKPYQRKFRCYSLITLFNDFSDSLDSGFNNWGFASSLHRRFNILQTAASVKHDNRVIGMDNAHSNSSL